MRHKMLTQRTLFVLHVVAKRYAESAFHDACPTLHPELSGTRVGCPWLLEVGSDLEYTTQSQAL